MSSYSATVSWARGAQAFTDNRYSRDHQWTFDGGTIVPASASPHIVPLPFSRAEAVDPEEAFVASLSSCHMLWFLSLAARKGLVVDRYDDEAMGWMERNAAGKLAITRVELRPATVFSGPTLPSHEELAVLHEQAHAECFIAQSVRTVVTCRPRLG